MIADIRSELAAYLDGAGVASVAHVWTYLPDDVAALPAVVVDLPDGDAAPELGGTGFDVSCSLFVIGRRLGDEAASDELDEVTDAVLAALFASSSPHRVLGWRGRPLNVAGIDVPAYIINTERTALTPC